MEKLKSAIPQTLNLSISQSNPHTLPTTCSALYDFLNQLPQFHQMLEDLAHMETSLFLKTKKSALEFKLKGNNCFSNGDNSNAMRFYTQALRAAPRDADDMGKNLVATLYVNRAAVLQKMGLAVECLQDCNRALAISRSYSKAWYRRGKANISMGNYDDAVCDLKVALCMEQSLSGKRQIEGELKLISDHDNGKNFPPDVAKYKESDIHDQPQQIQLQCVSTEMKGRGMVPLTDVPQATLFHTEEPYAAIVSKHCRETHCHFCFNELPADIVPCPSCSLGLYCSHLCQIHAIGKHLQCNVKNQEFGVDLASYLEKYVESVTNTSIAGVHVEQIGEHKHECGVNWPAALPTEIVLAGRVIAKSIAQLRCVGESSPIVNLELCHNYVQLGPEGKLELHISSIILLQCLHHSYGSDVPLNGETISHCVLLLSQIKVNSMAIVKMRSSDSVGPLSSAGNHTTNTVEQVRVGQAIYLAGSLFNHSCQPNIHTYFLSRTLCIRAIDFVVAGHPLELSYGPQVGLWSCKERQSSLKEQYAFVCSCTSCSRLNLSDLVINSFRCVNSNCSGVVLDSSVVNYEKQKVNPFSCGLPLQVGKLKHDEVKRVASLLCTETGSAHQIEPGFCLSCGAYRNLETSNAAIKEAEICVRRWEDSLDSAEVPSNIVSKALGSLDLLKSTLHPYNKKLAKVEDYLAQAFCSIGELQRAGHYCQSSIKILEKLYGDDNIVIGNELVKLASIQLCLGDPVVEQTINRINSIFSRHYGSHVSILFPHLQFLKRRL
ncbi:SET and MYND domain-containing protein 4 isoform X1 [Cynara cardunculus var. scolymus]|uniref:SET and MYND domain-containing protein 4 isoform X1 n=2 Tax=Cynara cardunculus var. scolymus TaxID=59895 RepID=UPI000D62FC5F|nr:SET and MYND domain-containing protein 4 isoform X1 [Cynara cardunculus var. scolymus]